MCVDVTAVDFDVVDPPFRESLRVRFEVTQNAGVASASEVAVVLVDAELQPEIVNLKI